MNEPVSSPTPPDVSPAGKTVAVAAQGSAPPADAGVLTFVNPGALPWVLTILLIAFVLVRTLNRVVTRISEALVKRRLVIKQAATFTSFAIYLVAAVMAASSFFNLSSQALFALSGSLAVIAGFAFKDFASSVLASVTILATRPFQVGDRISFGDYYGEVKDIGLRSVQLVTLDDNLVTIPSSKILTDAVANANAGALDCQVVIPFFVVNPADLIRAKEIVHDALLASRYLYLGKSFVVLSSLGMVDGIGVIINLTAKAYVYDARHEKAFAGDVTEMVLSQFSAEKIAIPQVVRDALPQSEPPGAVHTNATS